MTLGMEVSVLRRVVGAAEVIEVVVVWVRGEGGIVS